MLKTEPNSSARAQRPWIGWLPALLPLLYLGTLLCTEVELLAHLRRAAEAAGVGHRVRTEVPWVSLTFYDLPGQAPLIAAAAIQLFALVVAAWARRSKQRHAWLGRSVGLGLALGVTGTSASWWLWTREREAWFREGDITELAQIANRQAEQLLPFFLWTAVVLALSFALLKLLGRSPKLLWLGAALTLPVGAYSVRVISEVQTPLNADGTLIRDRCPEAPIATPPGPGLEHLNAWIPITATERGIKVDDVETAAADLASALRAKFTLAQELAPEREGPPSLSVYADAHTPLSQVRRILRAAYEAHATSVSIAFVQYQERSAPLLGTTCSRRITTASLRLGCGEGATALELDDLTTHAEFASALRNADRADLCVDP